jgi:hypothetical protein
MRTPFHAVFGSAIILATALSAVADSDSEKMLQVLLRPTGWSAEWSGPGGAGLTEVIFERRSDLIFAKIRLITPFELTCENPVTVEPSGVTFDGCRDPRVSLVYDPTNAEYPLRGRSPRGYEWKVKPK